MTRKPQLLSLLTAAAVSGLLAGAAVATAGSMASGSVQLAPATSQAQAATMHASGAAAGDMLADKNECKGKDGCKAKDNCKAKDKCKTTNTTQLVY